MEKKKKTIVVCLHFVWRVQAEREKKNFFFSSSPFITFFFFCVSLERYKMASPLKS